MKHHALQTSAYRVRVGIAQTKAHGRAHRAMQRAKIGDASHVPAREVRGLVPSAVLREARPGIPNPGPQAVV